MNPPESSSRLLEEEPWFRAIDPRSSLTTRATLVVGGGAVVFTLLLSWVAGSLLRRHLELPVGTSLETLAVQFTDKLDRAAYERASEIQSAATLAAMRSAAMPLADRRQVLETLLAGSPDYAWLGFADAEGKILSGTRGFLETTSVAARPWFRGALEGFFFGDISEVPELAREVDLGVGETPRYLALATAVRGSGGKLIGVLVAQIRWSWARDLQASVLTETARRNRVSLTMYAPSGDPLLDSGKSGWTEPPPVTALAGNSQSRGYFWETVPGDNVYLTGFARSRGFREFRGFGGIVAVRQPAAAVIAPVNELRRSILWWGLAFSVVLGFTAGISAARVTRRLRAIGTAADHIRLGDVLSLMPHARGEAELARMCGSLDGMVRDFREKQEKLDPDRLRPAVLPQSLVKDRDVSKFV